MKRMYSLLLIFYYLFFILSSSVLAQSPSSSFRSVPQPHLTKTLTRSYIPLSSNITLMTDNTTENTLIIKDYLNSTRVLIDKEGTIKDTESYYPYGSIRSTRNVLRSTPLTDKLFTGHRQLSDNLSLIHAGARYYSPTLGTFISPDTVDGPNRIAYVANNPVMFNDPSGNMMDPGYSTNAGESGIMHNRTHPGLSISGNDTLLSSIRATSTFNDPANNPYYKDPNHIMPNVSTRELAILTGQMVAVGALPIIGASGLSTYLAKQFII